jgi:hypothetical protein
MWDMEHTQIITCDETVILFLMLAPLFVAGLLAWVLKFSVAFFKFLRKISNKKNK